MRKTFSLWATIRSVHDGDTLYGDVDQGMGTWSKGLSKSGVGLRLYGCNARELRDTATGKLDPGAVAAREYLTQLIPVGTELPITCMDWDAWAGRIDVSIVLPDIGDLVAHLIEQQWVAGPYFGKGVKPTPPWPRAV